MNAVNFIDGLDGLVAGVALIANGAFFVYTYLCSASINPTNYFNLAAFIAAVLVGACAGFLPLNWHPAKMFMGDAGALLVGLLMATSAIAVTGQHRPGDAPDTRPLAACCRRSSRSCCRSRCSSCRCSTSGSRSSAALRAGKSPFSADRKHLHHRLLDMGHSHLHAVLIFYAWTAVLSVGCLLFLFQPYWMAIVFIAIGLVICAAFTFAPLSRRKIAERPQNSRRSGPPRRTRPRIRPARPGIRRPADRRRRARHDTGRHHQGAVSDRQPESEAARVVPSSEPVLRSVLKWGGILALGIAVVGAVVGYLVAGWIGVVSALIGAAIAVVFLGYHGRQHPAREPVLRLGHLRRRVLRDRAGRLAAQVRGVHRRWRSRSRASPGSTRRHVPDLIAGVIGSLVVDVLVVFRSRMPYVRTSRCRGRTLKHDPIRYLSETLVELSEIPAPAPRCLVEIPGATCSSSRELSSTPRNRR